MKISQNAKLQNRFGTFRVEEVTLCTGNIFHVTVIGKYYDENNWERIHPYEMYVSGTLQIIPIFKERDQPERQREINVFEPLKKVEENSRFVSVPEFLLK